MMSKKLDPITPGDVLLEEFLKPLGLSQNQLARAVDVPTGRINDIVRGKRGITRDTAARLAVFFRTTPDFWLNLQAQFDAKLAARQLLPKLSKIIRPAPAAA
jgi:addiction module HigA family antidote